MKKIKINSRSFRLEGCHVLQEPAEIELVKYSSDCGIVRGTLVIQVILCHFGVLDSGMDHFEVSFWLKFPGGISKVFTVIREFLHIYEIKEWILNLEKAILDSVFSEETANDVRKNHTIMKMLLGLTADFPRLELVVRKDAERRQEILDASRRR
ncbi:MAG: hypothetical protein A2V69_02730 [Candidatus Portnoybacteria bacterium RBG_13_40_8]|uniref:Uncharacterized protein n=1 Tax=Candidatus Portnoybacteria bacterium RBG_13_40_8 TaxID=1801990 RepID=A0A1G2F4U8_9BACT|nr:MAG: hypothetical protein A2V69_02730 [Candidatus Portnoybacteria bacterium RBG_13_40_8]OGZ35451.1 MAG: hypothetical protein A2V60_03380 [Candidatus Portnoybacteria bacterium RIFCSPHIGHO2_01_FULL_39_19]